MNNIFYFAFVGIIVVVSLYIILKILIKKFNPEESKVKLYGILQGMSNREIISISCSIISYVFMIYLMASFIDLDIYIAIIVLFLTLVSGILIKNKKVIIDLILSAISLVGIKVRIFDIENGLREYEDIKIIRIISKDYNLLIMKDYLPIIGEIEGSVDIKNDEVNLSFKDIKAFYMNSNNEFNLMIKEG